MRNWLRTLLFLSTFSPSLLTLAITKYMYEGWQTDTWYYVGFGVAGLVTTLAIMSAIRQKAESIRFTAKKIKANDVLMLAVIATWMLPFISKASEITPIITLMILICGYVALWFINAIPPHPMLRLFRYRFYEVESATGVVYTLITQRELRDPAQVKFIKRISSSMLVEVI